MTFLTPIWLYFGGALLALAALGFALSYRRRKTLLKEFASEKLLPLLSSNVSGAKIILKHALVWFAILFIVLALARPQYGYKWQETKTKGIDIIFALDASKSMLAEDVKPNRLDRAKLSILDMLDKLNGDRIGLVAFSGQAFLQCPLTLDYDAFKMSLEAVDTNVIQRGGTNIAAAIDEAQSAFAQSTNNKIIILLSDGEELEASAVAKAARVAEDGVKIYTLGVGLNNGEPLPVRDFYGRIDYVKDENGKLVTSKLNEGVLREIAEKTGGFYSNLSESGMEKIYEDGIKPLPQAELSSRMRHMAIERFQIPLGAAIILLVLESLVGTRKFFAERARRRAAKNALLGIAIVCALLPNIAKSQGQTPQLNQDPQAAAQSPLQKAMDDNGVKSPSDLKLPATPPAPVLPESPNAADFYNAALQSYQDGDYAAAKGLNLRALENSADLKLHPKIFFNTAVADYTAAKKAFEKSPSSAEAAKKISQNISAAKQCVAGGMELLRNAPALLKQEQDFKKNPPADKNAKPDIENPQFQEAVKNAVGQCEGVIKSADESAKDGLASSTALKSVQDDLDSARKNFANALELDPKIENAAKNLQNTNAVADKLKGAISENERLLKAQAAEKESLQKIVEELKKLLRDKNDQNKDNQQNKDQNQQNQDNKNQDKQNQDNKQDNQQNSQNKDKNQDKQNQQNQNDKQSGSDDKQNSEQNKNESQKNNKPKEQNKQDSAKDKNGEDKKENGGKDDKADNQKNQDGKRDDSEKNAAQKGDSSKQSPESMKDEGKKEQAANDTKKEAQSKEEQNAQDSAKKDEKAQQAGADASQESKQDALKKEAASASADKKEGAQTQPAGAVQGEDAAAENARRQMGVMTRREAGQMLDSLKDAEKRLPFRGYGNQTDRYDDKKYKDW